MSRNMKSVPFWVIIRFRQFSQEGAELVFRSGKNSLSDRQLKYHNGRGRVAKNVGIGKE